MAYARHPATTAPTNDDSRRSRTAGRPARHSRMGWVLAAAASFGLLALAVAPPFVGDEARHLIVAGFSNVCHQMPTRSPHLYGIQLAVCDRCLGIYGALAAASICFLFLRRWDRSIRRMAGVLLLATVFIPGVDWAGDVAGVWTNTPWSRVATGAVFGLIGGYFFTRGVVGLLAGADEYAPGPDAHVPAAGREK